MAKYVRVQAIERLKEEVEHGGGIATQEPAILSAQSDYLVALSSGLSLDETSIRRIMPLAVFISDDSELELFRDLVYVVINDLVPTLDADFISVPLAEGGSIGWRPAIRTNKRYTMKGLSERHVAIARNCDLGVLLATAWTGRKPSESEKAELKEIDEMSKRDSSLRNSAREDLERSENTLESAQKRLRGTGVHASWALDTAKTEFESAMSELEVRKAEYEMAKAKYESRTAMIEAFSKLAQLVLRIGGSCVLIVGSLHIFVPQTHGSDPTAKKIHVSTKSASETHANWTGTISEVLKRLAEELDSGNSE